MIVNKESTQQDHQQKVNRVLDYIARQLPESLSLYDLADIAALSPYHFHRVFARLTGESPGRLLIRNRLEKAAFLLRYAQTNLPHIARIVGYKSVDSLTKAFRKHFALSPQAYRQINRDTRPEAMPAFQSLNRRLWTMFERSRLVNRPESHVLYRRGQGFVDGHYNDVASQVWPRLLAYARQHQLLHDQTEYLTRFPHCTAITQASQCYYEACIGLGAQQAVECWGEFGVSNDPGGPFMVFTHHGPYEQLWESWRAIFQYWLPFSGHSLRPAASMEVYPGANGFPERRLVPVQLFLPVE